MAYKYLNDTGLKAYTKKVKGALKDLHTPIAISTENTTESMAQNVRNIADFIAKAKAAGIDTTKPLRLTLEIDSYPVEGSYDPNNEWIYGLELTDDNFARIYLIEPNSGSVRKNELVTELSEQTITSSMLTEGARKPIILTPETTEVDEETYQKLLSDDVDAVLKTDITEGEGNLCTLTYKYDDGNAWSFYFTCISIEDSATDTYIFAYEVDITKTSPHTCSITETVNDVLPSFIDNVGFLKKSALTPVLQEINLTGTDAERKAKLAQFEADWKALTGASDLRGARFVGNVSVTTGSGDVTLALLNRDADGAYSGLSMTDTIDSTIKKIVIEPSTGSITITPLFSHLEPVEIFTDNSAESKKKNIDNINTYKANLEQLGVDTSISFQVPIYRKSNSGVEESGFLIYSNLPHVYKPYSGLFLTVDETSFSVFGISSTGEFIEQTYYARLENVQQANTEMLDAIKYSYTPVPLTATTSTNKTQLDAYLAKAPNAQVMHVTYKDVYAGTLHKINGSWYGVLVGESNTLAGQLSIKLQADGTIVEGTA